MKVYTDKQHELMQLWKRDGLQRLNILDGSVRSGKTWITLVLWAFWVAEMPQTGRYLMVAKTLTSLRRNCLDLLQTIIGTKYFTYSTAQKEARLFGRVIYLEGANDARSESKIRGMTLQGAYCDELTLISEDFFAMLLSRLSDPGAKLFGTTNPGTPTHWLKQNYLDRADELNMLHMTFLLEDNDFLDPEYVENLKREYVGVFYDRYVLGRWVVAEGAIYRIFSDNPKRYFLDRYYHDEGNKIFIGVDFGGNRSGHAFVATAHTPHGIVALMSERHSGVDVDPPQLYELIRQFIRKVARKYGTIDRIYADSAETTLINGMRAVFPHVRKARKNPINDRIRATLSMMALDKFKYTEDCKTLVDAFSNAVYDDKGTSTEDERLDDGSSDIDSLDAFEYSFEAFLWHYSRAHT